MRRTAAIAGLGALCASVLASCAILNSDSADPSCGPAIDLRAVRVLDLRSLSGNPGAAATAAREQVGDYRLATAEPIWVPSRYSDRQLGTITGISDIRSLAANWGCNLLLVLDTRMIRSGASLENSKQDRAWLIQVGTRGGTS